MAAAPGILIRVYGTGCVVVGLGTAQDSRIDLCEPSTPLCFVVRILHQDSCIPFEYPTPLSISFTMAG